MAQLQHHTLTCSVPASRAPHPLPIPPHTPHTTRSITPTFAACAVFVNNARWDGVPFLLKAGKALHSRVAEIRVQFRHVPGNLYRNKLGLDLDKATNELVGSSVAEQLEANMRRLRLTHPQLCSLISLSLVGHPYPAQRGHLLEDQQQGARSGPAHRHHPPGPYLQIKVSSTAARYADAGAWHHFRKFNELLQRLLG